MSKLDQAIISIIHGLPWEEAKWVDSVNLTRDQLIQNAIEEKALYAHIEHYLDEDEDEYSCQPAARDSGIYYCFKKEHFVISTYGNGGYPRDREYIPEGQPITLSRVLQALDKLGWKMTADGDLIGVYDGYFECDFVSFDCEHIQIKWKLLKEDKNTATTEDQSEETTTVLTNIFF